MSCDFLALAAAGVRGLRPYQPGKPISELERELGLRDIVKLASNESPLGAGDAARAAALAAAGDPSRYPDGNGFELKSAIAARLGIGTDMITLGNGSNDVLDLAARAFVTPADEVVFSEHAFAVYPLVTQAIGARAVVTPARDHGHDLAAMAAAVSARTRLVFVANPNNPTGTWTAADALARFLEALPETVVAVVDEAYFEYVEAPGYASALALLDARPGLVVTRTFSKAFGLAGLRVGYAVARPEITDLLNRVRQPFNVNAPALAAAAAALGDEAHLERSRAVNRAGMAQLVRGVGEMGLEHIPSVGNFLAVRMPRPGVDVFQALLREGVIVRPIAEYGLPQFIRVTVGLEDENARFLAALGKVLAS